MGLREELVDAARERATERGRPLAVADLLDVALDLGTRLLVHGPIEQIRQLLVAGADAPEAQDDEVDEIFRRAAALSVGLDQPLEAEHVAVIATLHPEVGSAGAAGAIRHLLLYELTGPTAGDLSGLMKQLDRDIAPVQRRILRLEGSWPTDDESDRVVEPSCGRCGAHLQGGLHRTTVETDEGERIDVVMCIRCGATL